MPQFTPLAIASLETSQAVIMAPGSPASVPLNGSTNEPTAFATALLTLALIASVALIRRTLPARQSARHSPIIKVRR